MRANQLVAVSGGSRRSLEAYWYLLDPLASLLPAGNPRHLQGAWTASDLERIGVADRVLVLGAPLAAIEAVLALERQGHRGAVRLVSPRGLLHTVRVGIAPEVAEHLAALRAAGRLDVCAGDVTGAAAYGDTFVVDILPRGRTLHSSERYDWIVSCVPERDQR
ncbi:MAG TPA: hypothetical protein VNA66_00550 [Gammaproteobacteria bacterium]|jgi:uncharacterized NAD(P)/FAD-binding protein YdhS|nr:hypothetical protein [Gammaproteobacteria bacterium]